MKNVTEMTSAELVAEYNDLTGKSIKKFSTRKAGEAQVLKAREAGRVVEFTLAEAKAAEQEEVVGEVAADDQDDDMAVEVTVTKLPSPLAIECPKCGSNEESGCITANGLEGTAQADNFFCHSCGTAFRPNGKIIKPRSTAGEGQRRESVAKSWNDEAVRNARRERTTVFVLKPGEKEEVAFKSVSDAFKKLGLPMGKHIKFRAELKAAGKKEFGNLKFRAETRSAT